MRIKCKARRWWYGALFLLIIGLVSGWGGALADDGDASTQNAQGRAPDDTKPVDQEAVDRGAQLRKKLGFQGESKSLEEDFARASRLFLRDDDDGSASGKADEPGGFNTPRFRVTLDLWPGWNDRLNWVKLRNDSPLGGTSLDESDMGKATDPSKRSHYSIFNSIMSGYYRFRISTPYHSHAAGGGEPDSKSNHQQSGQNDTANPSGDVEENWNIRPRFLINPMPPRTVAASKYRETGSLTEALERMAYQYENNWDIDDEEFGPPSKAEEDADMTHAFGDAWAFIQGLKANGANITALDAAKAMMKFTYTLTGDMRWAQGVARKSLDLWQGATPQDRAALESYLDSKKVSYHVHPSAGNLAFNPKAGMQNASTLSGYQIAPLYTATEIAYNAEKTTPNDPLYIKGGLGKAGSAIKKGLGFLLGAVGASVSTDDKGVNDQWGLRAVGFKPRGEPGSAWDVADGSQKNIVVAVIDSGLDTTHEDGPQYLWINADEIPGNGIDDDANGYVDDTNGWNFLAENNDITDDYGHGTFVAGIIAAKRNNGEGIAGINPGAQMMTLKVLSKEGHAKSVAVYRAIRYAVDNGARVINLSLGGRGISYLEQIGINFAYTMGCVVVVAAGNEGGDIANYNLPSRRRVLSIGALDVKEAPRMSSNRGLNVALAAPGEEIYSLTAKKGARDGIFMPLIPGDYFRASGTSFSAPLVAGTASLLWARDPDLSNRQVEDMILQGAQDIYSEGWDSRTGYGRLDAYGALTQNPNALLAPRITEVFVNKYKGRIASVDLYGVIRGDLDHYAVSVGRGEKPKKWETVYGPSSSKLEYQLISRIDGRYFAKGSKWTVRLEAVDHNQHVKRVHVLVSKNKEE